VEPSYADHKVKVGRRFFSRIIIVFPFLSSGSLFTFPIGLNRVLPQCHFLKTFLLTCLYNLFYSFRIISLDYIVGLDKFFNLHSIRRPGSSDGKATDYGLEGPEIESQWGRDIPPFQTGPVTHPASCTMSTGFFPGVKCGRGVLLTPHPLLESRSWKNSSMPLPLLDHNQVCSGVTLPLTFHSNITFYFIHWPHLLLFHINSNNREASSCSRAHVVSRAKKFDYVRQFSV
jgi:hypothetical protein